MIPFVIDGKSALFCVPPHPPCFASHLSLEGEGDRQSNDPRTLQLFHIVAVNRFAKTADQPFTAAGFVGLH